MIKTLRSSKGFTLVELFVVLIIMGILATQVVFMFTDPVAKVKAAAFDLRGDLNFARSEAVANNEDVLVDFLFDVEQECQKDITKCVNAGDSDGYIICIDLDDPVDNICDATDTIIRISLFREEVQYYPGVALTDGPPNTPTPPAAESLVGENGVLFGGFDYVSMQTNGTSSVGGTVVVYVPKDGTDEIRGTPFAVVLTSNTGSVRIERWHMGDDWDRK